MSTFVLINVDNSSTFINMHEHFINISASQCHPSSQVVNNWNGHGNLDCLKVDVTRFQPGAAGGEWVGLNMVGKRRPILVPTEGVGNVLRNDIYFVTSTDVDDGWE